MRVHNVKHGRLDACRVSVSALFVMTSIFLAPFHSAKLKGEREKSVFSLYHLYVLSPACYAAFIISLSIVELAV
jgi:hypothetical protein